MKKDGIIVVGMERAGTKWLTSVISQNSQIAAPPCDRGGVHECNLAHFSERFPNLKRIDDYIACALLYEASDMYKDMDFPENYLYMLDPRPESYSNMIQKTLCDYASTCDSKYWVQKVSSRDWPLLSKYFTNVLYITIERDITDNLKSKKAMSMRSGRYFSLVWSVFNYVLEMKLLNKVKASPDCIISLNYNDLMYRKKEWYTLLCNQLDIPCEPVVINAKEDKGHSSFRSVSEREKILSKSQKLLIVFFELVFKVMPLSSLKILKKVLGTHPQPLVRGTFLYKAHELGYEYTDNGLDVKKK